MYKFYIKTEDIHSIYLSTSDNFSYPSPHVQINLNIQGTPLTIPLDSIHDEKMLELINTGMGPSTKFWNQLCIENFLQRIYFVDETRIVKIIYKYDCDEKT